MGNAQIWRSGTTIVQAIFDNWSRDIPVEQTQNELLCRYDVSLYSDIIKELYRLYNIVMDVDMRIRG